MSLQPPANPQSVVIHNHASGQPIVTAQPIATVVHRIAPLLTQNIASAPPRRRVRQTVIIALIGLTAGLAGGWYGWQQGWFDRLTGRNSMQPGMESAPITATPTPQMAESPTRARRIASKRSPFLTPLPIEQPTPEPERVRASESMRLTQTPSPTPVRQQSAIKAPCLFGGQQIPCS